MVRPLSRQTQRPLPMNVIDRGQAHHWRTGDLDIPCQVASPQSLTPFLQAKRPYPSPHRNRKHHWTPEPCLRKSTLQLTLDSAHNYAMN